MSLSLRDQLLQAGLVTDKQVRKVEQEQQRDKSQPRSRQQRAQAAEHQRQQQQRVQAEKAARDQELARKQQEKVERKERWAQVRQLIEQHRVPRVESEEFYHFTDGRNVKRIMVNAALRERILRGELLIARCDGKYDLVPREAAERIRERAAAAIIAASAADAAGAAGPAAEAAADDPYKDHVVPDDLMW